MIEIRSLKPFCPVITTCAPEHVESALAVRGLTREEVILVASEPRTDIQVLRDELSDLKEREAEARSTLRELRTRESETAKDLDRARTDTVKALAARDEARTTIRGLCRAFGVDPDAAVKALATPTPEPATAAAEAA